MTAESDLPDPVSRRAFLKTAGAAPTALGFGAAAAAPSPAVPTEATRASARPVTLDVNGERHDLRLEPRVTLLDALREHLGLMGTKKGCDRGQCGACTVLVAGRRVNSCLTLAVMEEGRAITTVEGLGRPGALHPMQAAFVAHDAFQCGYCTPGQLCAAVALVDEARAGAPSALTADLSHAGAVTLDDAEIRERLSGNLCRCGAYPNIVRAVHAVIVGGTGPAPA